MIQQRNSGMSLEAIAQEHDITRQRVLQILAEHDKDYYGKHFYRSKHSAYLEKIRYQASENPLAPKSSLGKRAAVEKAIGQAGALRHTRLRTGGGRPPSRSRALMIADLREAVSAIT